MSLSPAPDTLFELISFVTGGAQREKARALASGDDPDGDAANLDVLAALQKFSGVRPHPEAFVEALEPLQPRLYSISSSHNATPGKLSLTVDAVRYVIGKRKRLGLASTFLAERINPGEQLGVYVQKAHGFGLPQDPNTPVIMIGPAPASRRSAPSCTTARPPRLRAATGCSSAISAVPTISSIRTNSTQ
jgi:sulfite reductase (NADPH) flavoprotein alpha-component